jgi:hypothetical protein
MLNGAANGESGRRMLVREVNARIEEISRDFGGVNGSYDLICECGRVECVERVEVPVSFYQAARPKGCFLIAPGHDSPGADRVVTEAARCCVVAA